MSDNPYALFKYMLEDPEYKDFYMSGLSTQRRLR